MFTKLRKKWNVDERQFFVIFITFAITGTFSAWVSRGITTWLEVDRNSFSWWALKILVLLVGYQIFLLFFGYLLGQFTFFWNLEKRFLQRIGFMKKSKKRIAIFASGAGSNARKIIEYIHSGKTATVSLIVCNNPHAGVLEIARDNNIPSLLIEKSRFQNGDGYMKELAGIDLIVLAGFLWKIPDTLINNFCDKIINIHPALLPKYGGKGMYGHYVHDEVIKNHESETGITIHKVDGHYDNGDIIFQAVCTVEPDDTAETIARKVQELEHRHYPEQIEKLINRS